MTLAIVRARASLGLEAPEVLIEVHLSNGLPGLTLVGLPETAVKESRERVRSALINAGFEFPSRRITLNLAPADLPKDGGRFDLPIALGILMASGQVPVEAAGQLEVVGELALDGALRPVTGVLPTALAARRAGRGLIVPLANADEAALADGVVTPRDRFFCPGHFRLGRRVYRCWRRGGHGDVDLRDALKRSCDVYFYQVGLQLGVDRIADFARAFQLGRRTGFPFGDEKPGLVPTRRWKERRFSEPWQKGETVSASIGQGFSLVTPMQMAVAYAAIANGGVILEPRVILERVSRDGEVVAAGNPTVRDRLPVAPEYLKVVRDALESAVAEPHGTGGMARIRGVRVAGKTGTAQVVRLKYTEHLEQDEIPIRHRDHAWFVGFAPADAAEIVVVVLVEHGGHGGAAAAPIARKVLARYFEKQ
ncbi:MAG: hypothetical protein HRU39_18085, partial [Salinicola sp.]|uniref:penicillin-binding transpeptidase domain-containing protein n=1 Tax=Salinicola sp. TaxID=1978524 RepID=UPI001DE95D8D